MKVSVCIPVYNVEKYIERCARSLFEQTMKEGIEFVFVDDCSTDGSFTILKEVLESYPGRVEQVKLLKQDKNSGVAAARTLAFRQASGEYVLCCDADDYMDIDYCEKLYREAARIDADAVVAGYVLEFSGKSVPVESLSPDGIVKKVVQGLKYSSLCTKMIRAAILKAADVDSPRGVTMGEDLMLTTKSLSRCRNIGSVHDTWYHYRQVKTSKIHKYFRRDIDQFKSVILHLQQSLDLRTEDFDYLRLQYICMGFKAHLLQWREIEQAKAELACVPSVVQLCKAFGWKRTVLLLLIFRGSIFARLIYGIRKCCFS